jgi:hypothetical protein
MSSSARLDGKTRLLLICGALAGPFFTIIWFLTGLTRANYDPMRHPISALALGESGWTQVTNFIITGVLAFALAYGLQRALPSRGASKWVLVLFYMIAIGFLGTGFFATDPLNGYPPGTPAMLIPPTVIGSLHLLFASFIFGLPMACFVLARLFAAQGEHNWALYSRATAIAFIIIYLIGTAGFIQVESLVNYAGLFQRISTTIGLAWMTLLPIYLLHSQSTSRATGRK